MSELPPDVVPLRFDLSDLVRGSVATLYSHLVTRPTGQALRLGIEAQIRELGAICVTVLDFSQVVVLDYSCADETIAKLIRRFQRDDGPRAYFLARGVDDRHRETIETVLNRQGLTLVVEDDGGRPALLGAASQLERRAWLALQARRWAAPAELAVAADTTPPALEAALDGLARRGVVVRRDVPRTYFALSALLQRT